MERLLRGCATAADLAPLLEGDRSAVWLFVSSTFVVRAVWRFVSSFTCMALRLLPRGPWPDHIFTNYF